jgi:hypothetical protein
MNTWRKATFVASVATVRLRLASDSLDLKQEVAMAAKRSPKYGSTASKKVGKAMHERKRGTLRSGNSGKKITSRKQAIAIGLSEARLKGG